MRDINLRTFVYIDVLQSQLASFNATVSQGYLPKEGQASLYVEIEPGMAINELTDVAIKRAGVEPGFLIVERKYGMLELHSFDHGAIRAAGEEILDRIGCDKSERMNPEIMTSEYLTGIEGYQSQLINRYRHGDMLLEKETLYVLEIHPAAYAAFAANEAEKASPINLLEMRAFGKYGRVQLGGSEAAIEAAEDKVLQRLDFS